MRISIALATYNGQAHLQEQLDSFLSQSVLPDELVVCDDGSTDGTWSLLEAFRIAAPFEVRLLRQEQNGGHVAAFERAMSGASGDLVFLSDQDDRWLPNKLERISQTFAEQPNTYVVTCDQAIANRDLILTGQTTSGQVYALDGESSSVFTIGCCSAYRSSLRAMLIPIPVFIDSHDIWLHYVGEAFGRQVIPDVLQHHRRHGDNTSTYGFPLDRPPSRSAMWREKLRTSALPDLEYRKAHLGAVLQRMDEQAPGIASAGVDVASIRHGVAGQLAALDRRIEIADKRPATRLPLILRSWRSGDYSHFSAGKSAARDLLGRRSR